MLDIGAKTKVQRSGKLLEAEIDGEIVALDVARGLCFGLDEIGSRVWRLAASETTPEQICDALISEFEVNRAECTRDVCALLAELHKDGLIAVL